MAAAASFFDFNVSLLMRILLASLLLGLQPAIAAAALLSVDLGPQYRVVGVTRLADGTALLVGNTFNSTTNTNEAVLFTVSNDGSSVITTTLGSLGGDTFATGISHNGLYISGYSVSPLSVGFGEGAVWEVSTPGVALGVGFLGTLINQSAAYHVSNGGVAVGHADGARQAFSWSVDNGIQAISAPSGAEFALGVSDRNNVVIGAALNNLGTSTAAVWNDGTFSFLEDPFQLQSRADDISPDGSLIGGFVAFFDFTTFETFQQAAVWENEVLRLLTDVDGNPFEGDVLGVSSNGYAVGESEQGGFIWHEGFAGVRLFDEWLLTEHGLTLPTAITSVNDIYFDGTDLNFALAGSAYYVRTTAQTVPEPSTFVLLLVVGLGLIGYQWRRAVKGVSSHLPVRNVEHS